MKKLEMKKMASDLAFANAGNSRAQLDAAVGNNATEQKLSEGEYNSFKNDASLFWTQYSNAKAADDADAKLKKPAPAPAAVPQPAK